MKSEKFDDIDIFIQGIETYIQLDETSQKEYLQDTASTDQDLKSVITAIAKGFSDEILEKLKDKKPSEIQIELTLGFSEQVNAWIIGVKGDQKVGVRLSWKY